MLQNTIKIVNGWAKSLNSPHFIAVRQEEDWTIIPVSIVKNNKESHVIEDGIRTFCNHLEVESNNCTECGEFVEQDCE